MENNRSLTQSLVHELGLTIVCGTYSAENPFPIEAELCKQYDVSRSVLREAVKMLTSKGLLNARPRQGTWVQPEENWNMLDPSVLRWLLERKFSIDLLIEFTEIRLAIEPQAAEYATIRGDQASIEKINAAISRMEAASKGEDDPLISDIEFHVAIVEASGNRFFIQLRDLINTALRSSIHFTNQVKGVQLADVEEHKNIAEAISNNDPVQARVLMTKLLSETMDIMKKAREKRQMQTDKLV